MLSIQIQDTKNFMSHLLSKETFDKFYLVEASVKMGFSFHIDGHVNHDFYDSDTVGETVQDLIFWKESKPFIFNVIKGKRLPLGCKIVLAAPESSIDYFIRISKSPFKKEDIEGMYLNILYDPKNLLLTTGISYRSFSLNKSLEQAFEDYLKQYLKEKGLV